MMDAILVKISGFNYSRLVHIEKLMREHGGMAEQDCNFIISRLIDYWLNTSSIANVVVKEKKYSKKSTVYPERGILSKIPLGAQSIRK